MDEHGYRQLKAWQRAMDVVDEVYRITRGFPVDERFGLISQMRRSAVSIPSNIAEGYGRGHPKEYVRHLMISRGSLMELETQLMIAVRQDFCPREAAKVGWELCKRPVGYSTACYALCKVNPTLIPETRNPIPLP